MLRGDEVTEADCGERYEAVVERVEVRPVFLCVEQSRRAAGDDGCSDKQNQHHPVDGRFPVS